jgi:hypothetical protein
MASEPEVSELSVEQVHGVTELARALVTAVRSWTLYPPEHPAVHAAHLRFVEAIQETTTGAVFAIGVTPQTLLIQGRLVPPSEPVTEAAELLHDRDLLRLTFSGAVPLDGARALVKMLCLDTAMRRERGGPVEIWARDGHSSITLEEVDYGRVLEDREEDPSTPKRDDVWQSIVNSIVNGKKTMDEMEQQRLLAMARDPDQIHELAAAVMGPKCASDGSPMITTQAITVLAAFQHLASIVSVKAPDQMPELMRNLASATASLDPHVIVEMMQKDDDPAEGVKVVEGMSAAFDDEKVAQLLATALATEGQATDRLAEAFEAIVPDAERKRRVLTMARSQLSETDFGRSRQFKAIWSSIEQLLLSYNETPFVSDSYRSALAGAGGRAATVAARDLPEELPEWMDSLGLDNMRRLSVTLIVDLLKLERDQARAAEIASDMALLAEDLLMSGDYAGAREVAVALDQATAGADRVAPAACREALDSLAGSIAMQETVAVLGELEASPFDLVAEMCRAIGPAVVDPLTEPLREETETPARLRATDIIVAFGPPAVARLGPLMDDSRPFVQCHGADILGRIATPEAVPLLQPLLRRGDPRVTRHAVAALAGINDPAAARAIHTVLRTATGEVRAAVVAALVAERDVRVVPMLVRILDESQPFGKDHSIVIDALGAMKIVHTDQAVPPVARLMRRRRWLSRARTRRLKQTAVDVLVTMGSPAAAHALDLAAVHGDRLLRKIVKQARPTEAVS